MLKKAAAFTDIHWGARSNSEVHNQDCLNYIDWFCDIVKKDPTIDHICFLGDWHETRTAINIATLKYSLEGAERINALGLPVYFIIGNHDLYHKHSREVYSVKHFQNLSNFNVIEELTIVPEIINTALFCPFLFPDEYIGLQKHTTTPIWWGHFEFKGFIVTGYNIKMLNGPEPTDFNGPKRIFSGHFHKRQSSKNIQYIGNTFPTNYGDAGDNARGMMIYDYTTDKMIFHDWAECPKYIKTTLSSLMDNTATLHLNSRVICDVDVPITFEESMILKQTFVDSYKLLEFSMEESQQIDDAITGTETVIEDTKLLSVNELVVQMLQDINTEHVNSDMLIQIYRDIRV